MTFSEHRAERLAHVRKCLKDGVEPDRFEMPIDAVGARKIAYDWLAREEAHLIRDLTRRAQVRRAMLDSRMEENAARRVREDRERKQVKRLAEAAARGIPLRRRTDCSKMTVDEARAHRRMMERNKPSRSKPSRAASTTELQRALTDDELEALRLALELD